MITGDNAATAAAIAAECGILPRPLQQQVEETLAARACSGVSSSQYNVQLRQLLAELPLPQALQQKADGLSKQQQQPGWLDGLLHGLSGAAGGADPAAGAALMNSVVGAAPPGAGQGRAGCTFCSACHTQSAAQACLHSGCLGSSALHVPVTDLVASLPHMLLCHHAPLPHPLLCPP